MLSYTGSRPLLLQASLVHTLDTEGVAAVLCAVRSLGSNNGPLCSDDLRHKHEIYCFLGAVRPSGHTNPANMFATTASGSFRKSPPAGDGLLR